MSTTKENLAPCSWHLPLRCLYASMRSSLSSLLWTKQAQLPQPLLIREMCPYKTLPRAFIADQVPFLPQCSAFHPAARGISSRAQHQPYLVHRAQQCPPSLLFPHLIPHTQFTGSPLGRQDVQCNCPMSSSSPWIFVGCKPTSLLQPLTFPFTFSFYSWQLHCGVWPQW